MTPPLCTALRDLIASWQEYQWALGYSESLGELTTEELLARQNYDTALAQFERANHTHQEAAA
jgi:hypothetical protein